MPAGHYFVSFGRERGGLLALLGLRPDAAIAEIRRKCTEYRSSLTTSFRETHQKLKKSRDDGLTTKEEFDAELEKASKEKTDKTANFNTLVTAWDRARGQLRGLANTGRSDNRDGWKEMYRILPGAELQLSLRSPSPLPQFDATWLQQVRERWLGPPRDDVSRAFPLLASTRASIGAFFGLSLAVQLANERRITHLMAADLRWLRLRYTNREFWQKQLAAWTRDIEGLGPRFNLEGANPAAPLQWEYPGLCQREKSMIERLEAGKASGLGTEPPATEDGSKAAVPRAILEMLARLGAIGKGGGAEQPGTAPPMPEELVRLLIEGLEADSGGP